MISLKGQIADATQKGYTEMEIATAVKRAVVPGEMKTYLDSMSGLTLEDILIFIGSVLKERSSTELFQDLTAIVQKEGEDDQSFFMRAMELRQKCLIVSKKPGEVPYQEELVQTLFLRSVRMGLASDAVKSRLEAVIARDEDIADSVLMRELNKISSEEGERESKRMRRKTVRFGAVETSTVPPASSSTTNYTCRLPPHTSGNADKYSEATEALQVTVKHLTEQMSLLTQEVTKLKHNKPRTQTSSYPLRRSCIPCASTNQQAACRHCWKCGESGHLFRDCSKKVSN